MRYVAYDAADDGTAAAGPAGGDTRRRPAAVGADAAVPGEGR